MLPAHRCYVEPFFGSGAVLFAKRPSVHEIVSDTNAQVVNFFRVLRERPRDLARACVLTPYARDEYAQAGDMVDAGLDEVERARRFWVRSVMSYNGCLNSRSSSWRSSALRGSSDAMSAATMHDRLLAVAERLRRVVIDNAPACRVIAKYGVHGAVIYADPPYLGSTRTRVARGSEPDYACDFASEDEHRELAEALRATDAVVLLSGYPSALYDDEQYPDWWRLERVVHRPTANRPGRGANRAIEVIWSNRRCPRNWSSTGREPASRRPAPATRRPRRDHRQGSAPRALDGGGHRPAPPTPNASGQGGAGGPGGQKTVAVAPGPVHGGQSRAAAEIVKRR